MITIVSITLENEMDLVLAHKRCMRVAEKLGLTIATQTTIATAVSEIARSIIEYTDGGVLHVGLEQNKTRYNLRATIAFEKDVNVTTADAGMRYAQKLMPEVNLIEEDNSKVIEMKMGLPRSIKLDKLKINLLREYFASEVPINAYEEIKQKNVTLHQIAGEQEEVIRQSKLIDEKKTEFLSMASHEIKTPLTILKAYTQMAKATKEPVSEHLKGLLGKIDTQSEKLITLVQQLLDISRIDNGNLSYNLQTVSLNHFLNNQVNAMRNILPHHKLTITLCEEDKHVNIDELRMEQVLSNLFGNAAKYSEKETCIQLTAKPGADGTITVAIRDEGRGISEQNLKAIFDKFYRVEDVVKTHSGLGMGLYVSSKIITEHGGQIWAESEERRGSTFYFTLPLVEN